MMDGQSRSSPAAVAPLLEHGAAPVVSPVPSAGDPDLWRRRIRHDIRHELGTIIMLASAMSVADDVGPASRRRVDALLGETRWLDHLLRRLDEDDDPPADNLHGRSVRGRRRTTPRPAGTDGVRAVTPGPAVQWA